MDQYATLIEQGGAYNIPIQKWIVEGEENFEKFSTEVSVPKFTIAIIINSEGNITKKIKLTSGWVPFDTSI